MSGLMHPLFDGSRVPLRRLALMALGMVACGAAGAQIITDEAMPDYVSRQRHQWIDAQYHVHGTAMFLDDASANSEVGPGIELSGPDPFRDLSKGHDKKVAGNWRLGVNAFDYTDAVSGTSTKLTMLTVGAGWDYYFRGGGLEGADGMRGPFVTGYLMGYLPQRDGQLPNREDRGLFGVNLGGGYQTGKLRLRFETAFLVDENSDATTFAVGYQF